jgi:uncharacterized coiled-coil DUF342 family protein
MNEKKAKGFSTSIYVTDREVFEECKRLLKLQGRSLSEEIMDFVLKRLNELRGTVNPDASEEEANRQYEELKAEHTTLFYQARKMAQRLQELHKEWYDDATVLIGQMGLRKDLSNAQDIIPKFIEAWDGSKSFLQEFLSMIEVAVSEKRVEERLAYM